MRRLFMDAAMDVVKTILLRWQWAIIDATVSACLAVWALLVGTPGFWFLSAFVVFAPLGILISVSVVSAAARRSRW